MHSVYTTHMVSRYELTEEYAEEAGMTVDQEGFDTEMEAQRERARNARQDVDSMQVQNGVLGELKVESQFVGYDTVKQQQSKLLHLLKMASNR